MFTMKLNKINWLLAFNLFVAFAIMFVSPSAKASHCPVFTSEFWSCLGNHIKEDVVDPVVEPIDEAVKLVTNEFDGLFSLVNDYTSDPRNSFAFSAAQDVSTQIAGNLITLGSTVEDKYKGSLADFIYRRDFDIGRTIRFAGLAVEEATMMGQAAAEVAALAGDQDLTLDLGRSLNLVSDIVDDHTDFSLRSFLTDQAENVQEGIGDLDEYLKEGIEAASGDRSQSAEESSGRLGAAGAIKTVTEQTRVQILTARAESIRGDSELLAITDGLQAKGDAAEKASQERDLVLASDINTASENSLLRDRLLDFRVNQANVRIDAANFRINETNENLGQTNLRLDNLSKRVDYNSRKASSGIASALAASTALAGSGNNSIGAGIGSWGGEQAISVSIKKSVNDKASISSSVSHTRFGTALSAGWNFNF